MALHARELRFAYATGAAAVAALLWFYGVKPIVERYTELSANLETEESKFKANRDILSRTSKIEEAYRRVEATFPAQDDRNPDDAFAEDVDAAAKEILPDKRRTVEPAKTEEIKGVTGYEFLTLNMGITGDLDSLAQLLKGFDQKGFLIKSLSIQHNRGIDDKELKLDVSLARIVKTEEETDTVRKPGSLLGGGKSSKGVIKK